MSISSTLLLDDGVRQDLCKSDPAMSSTRAYIMIPVAMGKEDALDTGAQDISIPGVKATDIVQAISEDANGHVLYAVAGTDKITIEHSYESAMAIAYVVFRPTSPV